MDKFFRDWHINETPKVLLADDSIANRIQLKRLLIDLPIQIVEAESGREAISLAAKHEFGAILLDVNMPGINGFETAEAIAKEGLAQYTPIIFLSGSTMDESEIARGYQTGAVDIIQWKDLSVVLPAKLNFYLNYYQQKLDLESTSQTKSEFLSNMSHELRTPLNSILVLAQLLADNTNQNLTEKQLRFAKTIFSAGTDLLNLINEILDLSKVESGMMEFVIDHIEISGFIGDIERKIANTATTKGLDFSVHVAADVPEYIDVDGIRVHQILNNLLSNAIKFTDSGAVALDVFIPAEAIRVADEYLAPGEAIAFAVKDTGIGIPENKKHLIFEAFRQVDGSIKRKYGGTGLGLSISKKLAHFMGGELIFQSKEGKGSTFVLYLPVAPKGEAVDCPKEDEHLPLSQYQNPALKLQNTGETIPPRIISVLQGKRVLLVEDDIVNVYVMLAMLDKLGMTVLVASNGHEALKQLETAEVDLVLMDMMMPEMDGFEATAKIKSNPDTAALPIIAVTARAMKGDREKCILAGADGYVTKPILKSALYTEIFSSLNRASDK